MTHGTRRMRPLPFDFKTKRVIFFETPASKNWVIKKKVTVCVEEEPPEEEKLRRRRRKEGGGDEGGQQEGPRGIPSSQGPQILILIREHRF